MFFSFFFLAMDVIGYFIITFELERSVFNVQYRQPRANPNLRCLLILDVPLFHLGQAVSGQG